MKILNGMQHYAGSPPLYSPAHRTQINRATDFADRVLMEGIKFILA